MGRKIMDARKIAVNEDGELSLVMVEGRCFVHGSLLDKEGAQVRRLTEALIRIRDLGGVDTGNPSEIHLSASGQLECRRIARAALGEG